MRQHGGRSREPSSVKFAQSPERLTIKIVTTGAKVKVAKAQVRCAKKANRVAEAAHKMVKIRCNNLSMP